MNKKLIFIIGSPRSGTTMLRDILSKCPEINVLPETGFYDRIWAARRYMGCFRFNGARKKLSWHLMNDCIDPKFGEFQSAEKKLEQDLLQLQKFDHISVFNAVANALSADGHNFVVEKTPHHIYFLKELAHWYPQAKFIYIVRNPVDVITSYMGRADFSKNHVNIAVEWSEANRIATVCMGLLRDRMISVKYEDIIDDPSPRLKKIFEFIGARFNERYLEIGNNSSFPQPGAKGVVKLRKDILLTKKQLSQVEYITSDIGALYDYVGKTKKTSCITVHYRIYIWLRKWICLMGLRPLGSMIGLGIRRRYKKAIQVNSDGVNNG